MFEKYFDRIRKHEKVITVVFLIVIVLLTIAPNLTELLPLNLALPFIAGLLVVCIFLLADDIIEIRRFITERHLKVYKDQYKASDDLKKFIENQKPKKVDMLEYSSYSIPDIIRNCKDAGIKIRLLLQHPAEAVSKKQQEERICGMICGELMRICAENNGDYYDNIEIRCYKERASLRGRNFDNKGIYIGWYTYRYEKYNEEKLKILGDKNPLVFLTTDSLDFTYIQEMFNRVFDELWNNAVPLNKVCEGWQEREGKKCKGKKECFGSIEHANAWLNKVSKAEKTQK